MSEVQKATVVNWTKPFSFTVRLEDGTVIPVGLHRSYFGRMTLDEALRSIAQNGPLPGQEVTVNLVSKDARTSGIWGVIFREPPKGQNPSP